MLDRLGAALERLELGGARRDARTEQRVEPERQADHAERGEKKDQQEDVSIHVAISRFRECVCRQARRVRQADPQPG